MFYLSPIITTFIWCWNRKQVEIDI